MDDKFAPIIRKKMEFFDFTIKKTFLALDDMTEIFISMNELIQIGSELILVVGDMGVDTDDLSRTAIEKAGSENVVYGTSVLPGAMLRMNK